MSEMGDMYKAIKEDARIRKSKCWDLNFNALLDLGYEKYYVQSTPYHWIFTLEDGRKIDFYPTTNKWMVRRDSTVYRGDFVSLAKQYGEMFVLADGSPSNHKEFI